MTNHLGDTNVLVVKDHNCTECSQNDRWNLTVKGTINALNAYRPRPKVLSSSLYDQSFSKYCTLYNFSLLDTMLNVDISKSYKLKTFTIHLEMLVNTFHRNILYKFFWSESSLFMQFQKRCRFKLILPYSPMITKTKRNR